ncbi:MAG: 50S ribosomal protein L18 [Deltaproteobacteria bacterium]|nr:50S ribosomal protein L18 [Deltaproteobacteria bacterium]
MAMKLVGRERRKLRIRKKVVGTSERPRLTVFRSARHIYAQVIDDVAGCTLAHASTLSKDLGASAAAEGKPAKKTDKAKQVGALVAKMCLSKSIKQVVFDRNGYKYHGRISALAQAARAAGLKF